MWDTQVCEPDTQVWPHKCVLDTQVCVGHTDVCRSHTCVSGTHRSVGPQICWRVTQKCGLHTFEPLKCVFFTEILNKNTFLREIFLKQCFCLKFQLKIHKFEAKREILSVVKIEIMVNLKFIFSW